MFNRPSRYFIEYTPREAWRQLHRMGDTPAAPEDYRAYIDVTTLRAARKQARDLLKVWEYAQPRIRRRTHVTAVQWDYCCEDIDEEGEEEDEQAEAEA